MIAALEAACPEPATAELDLRDTSPSLTILPVVSARSLATVRQSIASLVRSAGGDVAVLDWRGIRYQLVPGQSIRHVCRATLLPGVAPLKLACFRQEWNAETLSALDNTFTFSVKASRSLWQRVVGKLVGLEVQVRLDRGQASYGGLTGVTIGIKPVGCDDEQGADLLEKIGPSMLQSLHSALQAMPERRSAERFPWTDALRIWSIYPDSKVSDALVGQGRDLSLSGLAFHTPARPPTAQNLRASHGRLLGATDRSAGQDRPDREAVERQVRGGGGILSANRFVSLRRHLFFSTLPAPEAWWSAADEPDRLERSYSSPG